MSQCHTDATPDPTMKARPLLLKSLVWLAILAVLGAVFLAYSQPSLMQQLADRLWACF